MKEPGFRRNSRTLSRLLRAGGIVVLLAGFWLFYGRTWPYLGWLLVLGLAAWYGRSRFRSFALDARAFALVGLLLWPLDAACQFPVLRTIRETVCFGPGIKVYPSPSGHCTAYVYDFSFLDAAFAVSFAHGLGFPGELHFVPAGESCQSLPEVTWRPGVFTMDAGGVEGILRYEEASRAVAIVPRGQ